MTETDRLLHSLRNQRRHVEQILEGLDEEALRRPVLPSGWSCLGLVNHLAVDVEMFWFRRVVRGEAIDFAGSAWEVPLDESPADVFARYREQAGLGDAVIAATPLDAPLEHWPTEIWPTQWLENDVRALVLHVITETACHAGHLDATRELIDGRTYI
jgi:uncharacterized damage-inducible protein DinB